MINTLIVALIILILIIYRKLSRKIRILEDKIADLSKEKITTKNTSQISEQLSDPEIFTEKIIAESDKPKEKSGSEQQKDRLAPFFDFIQQNALTIIGIFTLVLGIGYFVKYAIDKNWIGENSRTGIGFSAGFALILAAHFLRKNYSIFSSIVTGGGIAVLYFTTTIAFREYHLFTQNAAFSITCLITLISIFLAYRYNSETLVIFSLFGGFLAPLMISTGQSNYIFLFTYLMLLNIGMLITVYLKSWKSVGWIAFIFTSVYLYSWTVEKTELISIVFYILTYIIFYAFALQNYLKTGLLSKSDILMLVLINFSGILGPVYIFNELKFEPLGIFPLSFALVNAYFVYKEYQNENFKRNFSVFSGISISLLTVAVALQFKTHLVTTVWAVEATLLLYIWKKTGQNIFRIFFYFLFPMVVVSQITTWTGYLNHQDLTVVFNPVFLTSLVVIAGSFFNLILLKKDPQKKNNTEFFENIFKILCFSVVYLSVLFEIIYQLSGQNTVIIFTYSFLYSIAFVTLLLTFKNKLNIRGNLQTLMIYGLCFLFITQISVSQIAQEIITRQISISFYIIHLIYLLPFIYLIFKIIPRSEFLQEKLGYWLISFVGILSVSFEVYRIYIFMNTAAYKDIRDLTEEFFMLHLTIIWAVLSCGFIFAGLKKNTAELNQIGFTLLGITILKLYCYDVWQMDNISRIIAFIILGIILLLSSFMSQRFKNMLKNLVERNENPAGKDI